MTSFLNCYHKIIFAQSNCTTNWSAPKAG